jgi:hypothetical protein
MQIPFVVFIFIWYSSGWLRDSCCNDSQQLQQQHDLRNGHTTSCIANFGVVGAFAFTTPPPPITTTRTAITSRRTAESVCTSTRRSTGIIARSTPRPSELSLTTRNSQYDITDILQSQSVMEQLVVASSLSYLSIEDGTMSKSPYMSTGARGLIPLFQVVDPSTESGATVFRWKCPFVPTDGTTTTTRTTATTFLIVACRGSATPINFSTNLKFELVPVNPQRMIQRNGDGDVDVDADDDDDDDDSNIVVKTNTNNNNKISKNKSRQPQRGAPTPPLLIHQGFQDASIGLWDVLQPQLYHQILHRVVDDDDDDDGDVHLLFTGHSLGAATATLCGYQYMLERLGRTTSPSSSSSSSLPPISAIVTFGGPRFVNSGMARYIRRVLLSMQSTTTTTTSSSSSSSPTIKHQLCCCYNLIHSYDPILQQNQALWDALEFHVIGEERVCESRVHTIYETNQLRQDVFAWNFLDHCWYLGIFVGPRIGI